MIMFFIYKAKSAKDKPRSKETSLHLGLMKYKRWEFDGFIGFYGFSICFHAGLPASSLISMSHFFEDSAAASLARWNFVLFG